MEILLQLCNIKKNVVTLSALIRISIMLQQINYPFSNIQVELLKLYSTGISDAYLLDLKNVISQFLFEKARNRADEIWTERNYNQETVQQWLSE